MRSLSCSTVLGYQSGREGPGKVGNRAFSERLAATRSVKRASAGAGNETVRQAAHAGRIALQGRGNLLGMLRNHPARSAPAPEAGVAATPAGAFADDGWVSRGMGRLTFRLTYERPLVQPDFLVCGIQA